MSITSKFIGVSLIALLAAFGAEAQQIQGINLPPGLCNGCTLTNPIITNPVINGTITGTALPLYLASPPPIGGTTPNTVFTSTLSAGTTTPPPFGGQIYIVGNTSANIGLTNGVDGEWIVTAVASGGTGGFQISSAGNGPILQGDPSLNVLLGATFSGTTTVQSVGGLKVSSGLAKTLTFAGGATNTTIVGTGTAVLLSPSTTANSLLRITGISDAVAIEAFNPAVSAYQNLQLGGATTSFTASGNTWASYNGSVFTVGDGTHTSFQVLSPGASNWVNFIQAFGNTSGNTPFLVGVGSTNTNLGLTSSGNGTVYLTTEGGNKIQFAALDNASGVCYPEATSGASAGQILSNGFCNLTVGSAGGTTTLSDANVVVSALSATAGPVWNTTGKALTSTAASQTAHFVYAAPTTTGAPTFRLLVASDLPVAVVPLSGTSASLGGSALLAGACSSANVTVTGATTSMAVDVSPAGNVVTAGVTFDAYVSATNTVTVRVCASVAATPTATTYNVRVLQ